MGPALYVPEDRPPPSADRVPTLTEVVELLAPPAPEAPPAEAVEVELVIPEWNEAGAEAEIGADVSEPLPPVQMEDTVGALAAAEPPAQPAVVTAPAPEVDPGALVSLVMKELAPRIDLLLEARLREALAPALARAADGLIRDARQELGNTLHELVHEAVARLMRQHAPDEPETRVRP